MLPQKSAVKLCFSKFTTKAIRIFLNIFTIYFYITIHRVYMSLGSELNYQYVYIVGLCGIKRCMHGLIHRKKPQAEVTEQYMHVLYIEL